jgi:anti-anti-sigma regulatory factor
MQTNEKIIDEEISKILESIRMKHIIIDCSSFNFTDSMGVDAILQVS